MHAAVVNSLTSPPRYQQHPDPVAASGGEVVVDVLAAALHPRVRSQADGSHYTSRAELPLIPGIDAVVRDADGVLRYALLDDTTWGTMAEHTVVDIERTVILPASVDVVAVAAGMNPAMSSWIALRRRITLTPGARVLVLGATGNAGAMAIQIAKHLGAGHVIAAGRNTTRLAELTALGADRTCQLDDVGIAADVDVVIDYLWAEPTVRAMRAMLPERRDRSAPLTWIQIGSVAGPDATIPSAALRSTNLDLVGSGIGSVSGPDFVAELPALANLLTEGAFDTNPKPVPLADVERTWTETAHERQRIVFNP